jgi:hypothetical protein
MIQKKLSSFSTKKDVTHGFSLPIPPEAVPLIHGAIVQPFGMAV